MKQTRYHSTKGRVGLYRLLSAFVTLSLVAGLVPSQSIAYAREGLAETDGVEVVEAVEETSEDQVAELEGEAEEATTDDEEQVAVTPDQEAEAEVEPTQVEGEEAAEDSSDDQAVADESPEAGEAATEASEEAAPDKKADGGKLTAKAGDATVTASYDEGTFEGPVTLHAENIDEGDARYGKVTDALDELAETNDAFAYDHARALDIWFENEAGEKVEPAKDVRVSINLGEAISQKAVSTDLVHIPDDGPAELIDDAHVADDGSETTFVNDEFSVYVVTANEAQHDGSVAVGDAYYTTLAEAIAAASDGDTINVIGDTADTGSVTINKAVTIMSNGADGKFSGKYLFVDVPGVTLGGGENTLTVGSVWLGYNNGQYDAPGGLTIKDGAVITSDYYPIYLSSDDSTLAIEGGTITHTSPGENKYAITFYGGKITEISGGTINGGINNRWGSIETISGGTIQGNDCGIYLKSGDIGTISGGTISGSTNGIFLESWSKIGSISGGTFKGESTSEGAGLNVDGGRCEVGTISGGVFIGCDAVRVNAELDNGSLTISNGVFKATGGSGYAVTPDAEANFTSSFSDGESPVRFIGKLDKGTYTVPDGYGPSTDTVSVDGVEGDFHYFVRIITITYDGNGGKTSDNKTKYTEKVTGTFQAAENDFAGPDGKVFKEWNTQADGNGNGYAEGDSVTPSGEMTLYAIWEVSDGPVSIKETGEVYPNIREAMAAADEGQTIVVNKNCSDSSDPIVVDKSVTIVAGDNNATSIGANLKVSTGKTLTLGSGDASGSTLTFKGGVNVTDGKVVFQDGIDLRKTLDLSGANAAGTITGGKIKASSDAIKLDNGAKIDSISGGSFSTSNGSALWVGTNAEVTDISGGTFVSTSGHGMDLYGTVKKISGSDTAFTGSACGIYVRPQGALNTIDNGKFSSSTTDSYNIAAGLFVQGKCLTINDGTFTGSQGAQFGNTSNFLPPEYAANAGVQINGGTFKGVHSYGIDFVANKGSVMLECSIKNATITSEEYHALDINGGYHFSEISGVTATGADEGLITLDLGYSNKPLNIDKITDCTFSALHIGRDTHVPTIDAVTVSGRTQLGGYNGDRATIGKVTNSSFGDGVLVAKADVDEFNNVTIVNGLKNTDDGAIDLITGANTRVEGSYATPAIENEGKIGEIAAGTFVGKDDGDGWSDGTEHALYNHGSDASIDKISGGTFTSTYTGEEVCHALLNDDEATIGTITGGTFTSDKSDAIKNTSTISSIDVAKEGDLVVTGVGSAVLNEGGDMVIKGAGVYVGTDNAIKTTGGTVTLEPGLTATIGEGRYQTTSNTPDSQLDGDITTPAGYHMVKSTTDGSVEGADGSFRYLVKNNTVIYDGNRHDPKDGVETIDGRVYDSGENAQLEVRGNDYFKTDGYVFIGWNTKADGSGDDYKPGSTITVPENGEQLLYAQWKYPVTITAKDASKTYDSKPLTEPGFTNTALADGDTHAFAVVMTEGSTITNAGTQPNVIATVDGVEVSTESPTIVGDYYVTVVNGTLTVNPKAVTITAKDAEKTYDSEPLTEPGFTATALETGDTHTFTVVMTEGSTITNAGTQPNVIATVDGTDVETGVQKRVGNYLVTTVDATLTVKPASLTITANDQEYVYDGNVKGEGDTVYATPEEIAKKVKVEGLKGNDAVTSVTLDGQETYASEYEGRIVPSSAQIGENGALTGNYSITYVPGKLTITESSITYSVAEEDAAKGTVSNGSESVGKKDYEPVGSTAQPNEGYHFVNWTDDNAEGAEVSTDATFNPGKNLPGAFTAHFAPNTYTIEFDANDGSGSMDDVPATYDEPKSLPENGFTRDGYTFTGWNTEPDGSGTGYADKAEILNLTAEDGATVTLYAQWAPNDSRISYNANGGEGTTPDTEGKTDEVVKVAESGFELEGHTFVGWNTEPDGSGDAYAPGDDFTLLPEATVLYAQWEVNEYVITFDPNGGTYEGSADPTSETHDYGDVITMKAPERDGYTFLYWKGSEYYVGDEYTVTEDHTFVAQWEKSEEPKPSPKPTPKPSPKPTPKKAIPQTGDPAATMPLALFAGTGLGLLLAAAVLRRRKA